MAGRVDVYLVCGGQWHDFDFARLELLKLLAADEQVRVRVAQDFRDTDAISALDRARLLHLRRAPERR